MCELWRAFVETGAVEVAGGVIRLTRPPAEIGSPESVREVVSQRLSRLSPATTDLLELAATAGSEFELDIVRAAAGLDEPALLAALDEAVRSGMLEELPARGLAYRFTHELVRRALYDRLSGMRRAELHLRVGEALEGPAGRSGRALADLAHHFAAAAPFGGTERGVEYNVLAARAASAALAFDEAATRLRTALELGIDEPAGTRRGLPRARRREPPRRQGGRRARGVQGGGGHRAGAGRRAAPRPRGDRLRGRVLAARGWPTKAPSSCSRRRQRRSATTTRSCASGCSPASRARSTSRATSQRAAVVRTSAIAMARHLQDRVGLAAVLMRSYWSLGASSLEEILAMLTEARDLGDELGNTEIRAEAMAWRVPTFVALCDLESARREVAALRETAEQTAQPFMLHVAEHYGSALALCDGRLEEAEVRALRSHEWSRLLTGRDASGVYGIQMFSIRREQGRLAELAPVIRILAGEDRRRRAVAARARRRARRARHGSGGAARARAHRRRRARPVPRVALAHLAHVPDRRVRRSSATRPQRRSSTRSSSRSAAGT